MADTATDRANQALGALVFSIINRDPIGVQMTALSDALTAMKDRVSADFAELRRLLDQSQANEAAALANDAADAATIAAAQDAAAAASARADELQASIDAAVADIASVDPDPSFPAADGGGDAGAVVEPSN